MIYPTEKPKIPSKFAKLAARYYEFGSKEVQLQIVTPVRIQQIQIGQANHLYYVNTSRCKDTENYPPSGGGWLVEAGKAVETAVGITVTSDDDTPVKGAQCLSIYDFSYSFIDFPRPSLYVLVPELLWVK